MDACDIDDPEDIFSSSLQSLYDFKPITFSTAGSLFTYTINPGRVSHPLKQIHVTTPDTDPSNWSLHASSIWVSSLFIADHLEELHIDDYSATAPAVVRILELGAGAGLPSILLASMYPNTVSVTASDYPDDRLIRTLSNNVRLNALPERSCRVVPYAWGTEVRTLMVRCSGNESLDLADAEDGDDDARFDIVFAADTLWNVELHVPFLETICSCLGRGPEARAHLVAGLYSGRYTIQSFIDHAQARGLVLENATEREVGGTQRRDWDVSHAEGEDEQGRRKWVVWIILKWADRAGDASNL